MFSPSVSMNQICLAKFILFSSSTISTLWSQTDETIKIMDNKKEYTLFQYEQFHEKIEAEILLRAT